MKPSPADLWQGVGLNPLSYWHHNDHLGPLCALLNMPLILTDKEWAQRCKQYYPGLKVEWVAWEDFSLEDLVQNYSVLFRSDLWEQESFLRHLKPLEEKYKKRIRTVHVPHGFSDKGFWLEKCADEDISLIYGPHMVDLLKQRNVWKRLKGAVFSGNYRLTYYKKYQKQLDRCVKEEVLDLFAEKQKILLYAPTWRDQENSSSFFSSIDPLIKHLPSHINLIVKLHPMLEEKDIVDLFQVLARYEELPNVLFLDRFPLVYPLLAQVDAYLGDASSIGYDSLAFQLPLFFLESEKAQDLFIHRCGTKISPTAFHNCFKTIETALEQKEDPLHSLKKEVYHYTFGEEVSPKQIQNALSELIENYTDRV